MTSLRVLVVEDEMLLAMDLEAMIEDSGHGVIAQAASLDEVEALPIDIDPQLAFVDLHLARGTNGFDVCRLVRERWPETLIVFVTANVSKIPPDFAGAHGVIAKPFTHSDIVNAIDYLADGVSSLPPHVARPASFVASPNLDALWMTP